MAKIPSIELIPSAYKSGKVYSVLPTDGSGDFNFARTSEATRVNQNGLIETVGSNVPRIDYTDGGCPKLLLEPLSRNLFTYSEEFDNVGWTKNATGTGVAPIITANQGLSPDGSLNADRVTFNTSASTDRSLVSETVSGITSGIEYTCSFYIKAWSSSDIGKTIVVRGVGGTAYTSLTLTDNWQRFKLTETSISTSGTLTIELRGFSGSSVGIVDALIWGAQLEEGSYATSYIPTNGGTVTREAETASKSGLSSYINSQEGVLYIETSALSDDLSERRFGISDGTSSNVVRVGYTNVSNRIIAVIYNGTNQAILTYTSSDITQNSKIAVKYKENDFALWVNGVKRSSDTSGSVFSANTLNSLHFNIGGGNHFYSKTKDVRVYNTALTDLELEEMTGFKSFVQMANYFNYTVI